MRFNIIKEILIAIFIFLLISIFFIHKPFHMDDTAYIYAAKNMLSDPIRTYPDSMLYRFNHPETTFDTIVHPPLIIYYIGLIFLLTKQINEFILHGAFLLFPIISLVSMYFLTKRLAKFSFFSCLILMANPAFMVMSQNIMLDLPLLAFFLTSVTLFIYGFDKNNNALLIISSIFITLTIMTKYTGLCLIPLLLIYFYLKRRPGTIRNIYWVFLMPAGILFLWNIHNIYFFGKSHIINSVNIILASESRQLSDCLLYLLVNLGGAVIFPLSLFYLLAFNKNKKVVKKITLLILFMVSLFLGLFFKYRNINLLEFALLLSTGTMISLTIIFKFLESIKHLFVERTSRVEDNLFIYLWFLGIWVYNFFFVPFGSVRYLLPLLPPYILIFINILRAGDYPIAMRKSLLLTIIFGFILAISVAFADYQWASIYRSFPAYLKKNFPDKEIYFPNHWGFQYYMERLNYKCLPINKELPPGVILVVSKRTANQLNPKVRTKLELISKEKKCLAFPIRVMHSGAGFYFHKIGLLPYAIAKDTELDTFEIYKVLK